MNHSTMIESKAYKSICKISFLCYYSALSVYAVINLYTLFFGVLNISSGISILLAIGAMLFAMANELIDMQMITNPQAQEKKYKNERSVTKDFLMSSYIWSILLFALIDVYTSINNMTLIQQNSLIKLGVKIPLITYAFYNTYFIATGLIAKGMTYLTNFIRFAYGSNFTKAKTCTTQPKPKNQTQIKTWLSAYIKNPVLMTSGVSIGAFLYAYGDFRVLFGLLLILTQIQMIHISTANIMLASVIFAACTFFERVLLWGHNFRRFENENKETFGAKKYFFHYIPKNRFARKALTTLRIGLLGIRGVMNAFVYFTGWKKYLGFLSTISYITASYVQSSLQVNHVTADTLTNKKNEAILKKHRHQTNNMKKPGSNNGIT